MRNKYVANHLLNRDGNYYFVRRVPDDVKSYYSSDRISMSLRTKSNGVAIRATKSICQRLDDYWLGLRLQKIFKDVFTVNGFCDKLL